VRDVVGTRRTVCTSLVLVVLGSTLIATAAADDQAALAAGMLFVGMGSGAQLCLQPVTALFQEAASTAMAGRCRLAVLEIVFKARLV